MSNRPIRLAQPRQWRSLALATVSLAMATPGLTELRLPRLTTPQPAAQTQPDATLWTVQAEGGEGGEAGAVAGAEPDVAYLAQLSIVEGHLLAAAELYANGQVDEAVGLSYHPEAEMMDEVRANLAAHGAADFTPLMAAFSATLEAGAPAAKVDAALAAFRQAVAQAQAPEADEVKTRFAAIVLVARAAANEYAGSIENGVVSDVMAYHEAHAFIAIARDLATGLRETPQTAAADKVLAALSGADDAFADITQVTPEARDPAILLAVAARVELAASAVR